jgi:hypothetical protein
MDKQDNDVWSSSVSTSSLMSDCEYVDTNDPTAALSPAHQKQHQKSERRNGCLTELTLEDMCIYTTIDNPPVYRVPNVIHSIRGSFSQFMAVGQPNQLLPPLTNDCCQTFSALAAILFSSFGLVVMAEECWNTCTVNYLVYLAAWLHQLTAPLRARSRPTVGDLNRCLLLQQNFSSKLQEDGFMAVLYERGRVEALVRAMCQAQDGSSTCGYLIVSGQYTVSIFALAHNVRRGDSPAWNLYIADSHGSLPWAMGKASISSLSLRQQNVVDVDAPDGIGAPLLFDEGVRHFCDILCALLEDNRRLQRTDMPQQSTPYMTWTPIQRPPGTCATATELAKHIDLVWVPQILETPRVADEHAAFGKRHPMKCFWGQITKVAKRDTPIGKALVRQSSQMTLDRFIGKKQTRPIDAGETADAARVEMGKPELDEPANLVPPKRRRL